MFIFEIMSTATKTSHIGRKISRIRELRGMKQEALAAELGISQQSVSNLNCTFNPLDRLVQAYEEKEKLYERLLKAEKEKVAYLEKLLDKK
mgnify:CR=1 FL=1